MALDLIKEYLVGIGFNVDSNSLNVAEQSITKAEKTINNFNENSNKGFSESGDSMKDFFSLLSTSAGSIGNLFPELQVPFKNLIKDITTVKKLFKDLNELKKKTTKNPPTDNDDDNNEENHDRNNPNRDNNSRRNNNSNDNHINENNNDHTHELDQLDESSGDASGGIKKLLSSIFDLSGEGGGAIAGFSVTAIASFAAIAASIAALILAAKGLAKFLNDQANQDIEYEKLSRQLWTTKENAKEVDMALKTMGATMQDLWLSPTLLKQFTQLRKDSKELKLPKEYTDNLKVVQGIGLEFSRLKQLGTLAFQWIGNYILKYAAGPLAEIKQSLHGFTDGLIKAIPTIAKVIGSVIGVLIRILSVVVKLGVFLFKLTSPIFKVIDCIKLLGNLFEKLPSSAQKVLKIIGVLILAIASPILIVIALIDDLFTYFRGGKSVVGGFVNSVKSIFSGLGDYLNKFIDNKIAYFEKKFEVVKKAIDFIKDKKKGWDNFWGNDEESKKNKADNAKQLLNYGLKFKEQFTQIVDKGGRDTPASYTTKNNTSSNTTANSNNKINTSNTFNVYGGTDAKSTADVVSNKVNGINARNLQGVY